MGIWCWPFTVGTGPLCNRLCHVLTTPVPATAAATCPTTPVPATASVCVCQLLQPLPRLLPRLYLPRLLMRPPLPPPGCADCGSRGGEAGSRGLWGRHPGCRWAGGRAAGSGFRVQVGRREGNGFRVQVGRREGNGFRVQVGRREGNGFRVQVGKREGRGSKVNKIPPPSPRRLHRQHHYVAQDHAAAAAAAARGVGCTCCWPPPRGPCLGWLACSVCVRAVGHAARVLLEAGWGGPRGIPGRPGRLCEVRGRAGAGG